MNNSLIKVPAVQGFTRQVMKLSCKETLDQSPDVFCNTIFRNSKHGRYLSIELIGCSIADQTDRQAARYRHRQNRAWMQFASCTPQFAAVYWEVASVRIRRLTLMITNIKLNEVLYEALGSLVFPQGIICVRM